jgi:hypothetical protein
MTTIAEELAQALEAIVDRNFTFFDGGMIGADRKITREEVLKARDVLAAYRQSTTAPAQAAAFLHAPGEVTAYRSDVVERWPEQNRKAMTEKLYAAPPAAQAAEPVAWWQEGGDPRYPVPKLFLASDFDPLDYDWVDGIKHRPLVFGDAPHPSEPAATGRVGLSVLDLRKLWDKACRENAYGDDSLSYARAIEAAHGILAPTGSAAPTGEAE